MKSFIEDFNAELSIENTQSVDPSYLVADLCQDFVMIHLFEDGEWVDVPCRT
jgi:hypothetical protein